MNIIQENTGTLEALIKIGLTQEDYRERVSKELKSLQKKAQMPGFRPGKVPFGMIQKMYGKSVLAEEINKVLTDALYAHIKDNKLNILGQPVPDRNQEELLDWDQLDGYMFTYRIGFAPEINLELGPEIMVDYHTIKVDDEMLENSLQDILRRFGKRINPGSAAAGDILNGGMQEMESEDQPKQDGHQCTTGIFIDFIRDEETKNKLIGFKPGDSIVMDLLKAVESEAEAASILKVKKEDLPAYGPLFRFTLDSITRLEPAEMNEELYEQVAPGKGIQSEEAFRELIRADIGRQYQADIDKHFRNEVRKKLIEITALPLPEDFLKVWLLDNNKEEITEEKLDKEFDGLADVFRWQLIENHLIKTYHVDVSSQDIHDHLAAYFRAQMQQYGQDDIDEEVIRGFISNVTAKEDEVRKVSEHIFEQKLVELFKQHLSMNQVELTFDEFVALVTEKYKSEQQAEEAAPELQAEAAPDAVLSDEKIKE